MRDKLLKKLAEIHALHPWKMTTVAIIITLIFAVFASQLSVTMRWSDLLPSDDPRTLEYDKILKDFNSASSIVVLVRGEENSIKKFADTLAPRLLEATDIPDNSAERVKLFQRVDYKREKKFLRDHALMLIEEDDFKNIKTIFINPNLSPFIKNLNNSLEQEYVGKEESISTREKEDNAVMFLDGIQKLIVNINHTLSSGNPDPEMIQKGVDHILIGDPYFKSYDEKAIILNVIPNFSMLNIDMVVKGTDKAQEIVDNTLKEFPQIKAGLTGSIPLMRDEMVYGMESANYTTVIAGVLVLIMLIIAFRMWVAPLFAMANLLIGILWAMGVIVMIVGQLNIMTQMMAVILLGLGIDFSIHFISGFTESRAAGNSILESMQETFLKSGKGIITGGLTTACAFLSLTISSSRGMKEMGLVTGFGLIAILGVTFLVLPIFFVFRERRKDKKQGQEQKKIKDISFRFLGATGKFLSRHYVWTCTASVFITLFMIFMASKITFDHNYLNMEPKGIPSITLQDTIMKKFDLAMDYALITADSPDQSRNLADEYKDIPQVAMVEDISLYLPSEEEMLKRWPYVKEISDKMKISSIKKNITITDLDFLTQELQRLSWNVMEMQDMAFLGGQDKVDNKCKNIVGDPTQEDPRNIIENLIAIVNKNKNIAAKSLTEYQNYFAPCFKNTVLRMCNNKKWTLQDLPVSIVDRYANRNRTKFLVTVYPSINMWKNIELLDNFVNDMEKISNRVTGLPPVMYSLFDIIGKDGRNALILTLIIVFALLWLDFRNPKYAFMAMIPLLSGTLWMVGLMKLTGLQFTVINVMGLPMIIGIGIDDGVHIVHRWLAEGRSNIVRVFASTGKAILLTSLTTMLAFGSLVFAIWRGYGSLGSALFLGVGACFLTTVLFLSSIMGVVKRNR
ncbi:MAG: MMPL family transporter [bacterium]